MTSGVPATMLITVSARALAATEKPEMGFRDPFAEQLVESLGLDPRQYCTFPPNLISAVFRSVFFDRITRAFFERHPDGVGLNIACGLGANYQRVAADSGDEAMWFDVDLPEAIEIRRRFFADTERRQAVAGDLTDPSLFGRLFALAGGRPTLVLMEGVLYYLDPAEVAAVFERLGAAHDLAGGECELGFDVVSANGLARPRAANTDLQRTETKLVWGCSGVSELSGWDARLQLVEIDDPGAFVLPEVQALFNEFKTRDGIAPMSVMHFKRSPVSTL